ncbi:MAG: NAD(P)-binding domain-containing protein [Chloroflexi bacterium]|nr:NAD(P)-binding domain-containing protein [Chloroflexota bacterium]
MKLNEKYLAVIGAGNIGQILLERLRNAKVPADHLVVCDNDKNRVEAASERFGVRSVILADEAVCAADAILIAVSPKSVIDIIKTFAEWVCPCRLVISFAAGVPLAKIEEILQPGTPVARIMPNAPSLIGKGINPVAYGANVTPEARELVEAILGILGESLVARDDQMNWCVGMIGAAMRSVLPILEGMTRAGIEAGFSEADSRKMAAQVMLGTATLALKEDLTFNQMKALTPMETLDEEALSQLFFKAAQTAQEKISGLQQKICSGLNN